MSRHRKIERSKQRWRDVIQKDMKPRKHNTKKFGKSKCDMPTPNNREKGEEEYIL